MTKISTHGAKTHFSELVAAVERCEEVFIARREKTVAQLVSALTCLPKAAIRGLTAKNPLPCGPLSH